MSTEQTSSASTRARESNTPEATFNWTTEPRAYRNVLQKKRESFWKQKIDSEKSSPWQLWRSIDTLMGRGGAPGCDTIDAQQLHVTWTPRLPVYDPLLMARQLHPTLGRTLMLPHQSVLMK